MSLTHPGDERLVTAAARELVNIMEYRGLSPDQAIQALIAASASTLAVLSFKDRGLLEMNLKMFCRQVRMRSKGSIQKHRRTANR